MLCYHKFGPEKKRDDYQMSPQRFEAQLGWLKKNGYTYLSLTQVAAFVGGTLNPVPQKPFGLTIDDGWDSGFYIARPLLKKYGFRAVFMVVASTQEWKKRINWKQMKQMEAEGFEIGSHSWAHTKLFRPEKGEKVAAYRARLKRELTDSKKLIEARLGHPITTLAYPFGGYNPVVEEAARQAGYSLIFTVTRGPIQPGDNPLRLKRVMLLSRPGLDLLRKFMEIRPLRVRAQGIEDGEYRIYSDKPRALTLTADFPLTPALVSGAVDNQALRFQKRGAALVALMPGKIKPGLHFLHAGMVKNKVLYEQRWLFQVYFKEWEKYFK